MDMQQLEQYLKNEKENCPIFNDLATMYMAANSMQSEMLAEVVLQ